MKTALASVLAAGVASACCIGPVAFVLLGAGTFSASLAALEPYLAKTIADPIHPGEILLEERRQPSPNRCDYSRVHREPNPSG